jgi:hypothetical protein
MSAPGDCLEQTPVADRCCCPVLALCNFDYASAFHAQQRHETGQPSQLDREGVLMTDFWIGFAVGCCATFVIMIVLLVLAVYVGGRNPSIDA